MDLFLGFKPIYGFFVHLLVMLIFDFFNYSLKAKHRDKNYKNSRANVLKNIKIT